MSSQLSAHAITAHTAMTRMSISRCSTLPAHRGSSSVEKCSTSFSTDIATLPSLIKGEPQRPVIRPSNPASPFHASPLGWEWPVPQYGHLGRERIRWPALRRRREAIDQELWRAGRGGGLVSREWGAGVPRGEKASLANEEAVGRQAQGDVVVQAAPGASL